MRGPPAVLAWDAPRALVCDAPSCLLARSRPLVLLSQPSLPPGYMRETLKPRQQSIYRAAGVLLYRVKGEEVEVLLGRNAAGVPGSSRHDTWNLLGGKRKHGESRTARATKRGNANLLRHIETGRWGLPEGRGPVASGAADAASGAKACCV